MRQLDKIPSFFYLCKLCNINNLCFNSYFELIGFCPNIFLCGRAHDL